MKYNGRLLSLLIFIGWLTIESLLAEKLLFFQFLFAIPLAWYFGKKYDEAKYFANEMNKTEEQLRKELSKELNESEERYRHLVEMSPYLIAVHHNGKFIYINNAGVELLGARTKEEVMGKTMLEFIPDKLKEKVIAELELKSENPEKKGIEYTVISMDGRETDVEVTALPIIYKGKEARQLIAKDISDRKNFEKLMEEMAYHDPLTGLANRHKLKHHIKQLINAETNIAIMFIDLDRFKLVNDTFGHQAGDQLLSIIANRLVNCIGENDLVSRQGGDEFIICLSVHDHSEIEMITEKILLEMSKPLIIDGKEIIITPSIGISVSPNDGTDMATLIQHADLAMYQAKSKGKNTYQFFSSEMNKVATRLAEVETALRKALDNGEFTIHYQPKVMMKSKRIIGAEALIRWNHPEFGFISPCEFIPIAEETGLIIPIGEWVLREACKQTKAWQLAGYEPLLMCVNLSVRQFIQDDFHHMVAAALQDTGLEPQYLNLELTESLAIQEFDASIDKLNQLKSIGVKLSLDDFGTGYSSLSYLKRMPIDFIKIDRSFVSDIVNDPYDMAICSAIVTVAHSLELLVIAEGIETEEQYNILARQSCDEAQGYYFSHPLPANEMEKLLEKAFIN